MGTAKGRSVARVAVVAAIAVVVLLGCTSGSTGTSDATATGSQSVSTVTPQPPATPIVTTTTVTEPTTTTLSTSTTTTTVTHEPPWLEVTDPQPSAVVTTAVYAFQGFTDPGCTVDVGGKYFADVDADGAWTLDLVLRPGGNATTITAADKNGVKTAVQVKVTYAPIVLRSDGLGIVDLGDSIDEALTALNGVLGLPTQTIEDSEAMLEPSRGQYGFGPDQTADRRHLG